MWKKLKRWSAMLLAAFLVVGSVEYTGLVAQAEAETETITVNMVDLTPTDASYAGTSSGVKTNVTGGIKVTYNSQYGLMYFCVPSDLDASKITNISYDNVSGYYYSLKVFSETSYEGDAKYQNPGEGGRDGVTAYGNTADISGFTPYVFSLGNSMQTNDEGDYTNTISVDSVSFTVTKDDGSSEVKTYDFKTLVSAEGGYGYNTPEYYTKSCVTHTFTADDAVAYYALPENVDSSKLQSVTFNDVTGGYVRLYLYDEAGYASKTSVVDAWNADSALSAAGKNIKYFGLGTNKTGCGSEPHSISMGSVTFTVEKSTAPEQNPNGGNTPVGRVIANNIIGSGYDANFEDGAWWNNASGNGTAGLSNVAYDETITAPTEDCNSKYLRVDVSQNNAGTDTVATQLSETTTSTYHEVPLTDLFVEGKTYEYSYWVRLESGQTGTVSMSLATNNSGYSSWKGATLVPDEEYTISDSGWTHVCGTFVMVEKQDNLTISFSNSANGIFYLDDVRFGEVATGGTGNTQTATSRYYTFNDAAYSSGYYNTRTVSDAGVLSISYDADASGGEAKFSLPAGVDGTTLSKISFKVSSGDTSRMAIKVYADGTQVEVNYEQTSLTVNTDLSGAQEVTFGIMNNSAEALDLVIDNICLTAVQTGGSETEPDNGNNSGTGGTGGEGGDSSSTSEKVYKISELSQVKTSGNITATTDATTGAATFTVEGDNTYKAIFYEIPADVDATKLEKIALVNPTGDTGKVFLRVMSEKNYTDAPWSEQIKAEYGKTEVSTDGSTEAKYITIGLTAAGTVTFEGVSFVVSAGSSGGSSSTNTEAEYTIPELSQVKTSGSITVTTDDATGAATYVVEGDNTYKAFFYEIPADVDATKLEKIVLNNPTGDTGKVFMRVMSEENYTNAPWSDQIKAEYGKTEVSTDGSTEAKYFTIGLTAAGTVTFDSVSFFVTASTTGGGNTGGGGSSEEDPDEDQGSTDVTGELVVTNGSMLDCTIDATGATFSFNNKNYESLNIALPGAVTTTNLDSITFDIEAVSGAENIMFALKYKNGDDADWGHTTTFVCAKPSGGWGSTSISKLGIMTHGRDVDGYLGKKGTVKFKGVTFTYSDGTVLTLNKFAAPKPTSVVTYHFGDLQSAGYRNGNCIVDERGRATLYFGGSSWGYYSFAIPEEIAGMKITKIKVYATDIMTGDQSLVAMKLYDDASASCDSQTTHYEVAWNGSAISEGGYNISDTDKVLKKICFAAGAPEDVSIAVRKIEFTVEGVVTGGSDFITDMEYHFNPDKAGLTKKDGWNSVVSYLDNGRMTFNSTQKFGETRFAYPAELSEAALKNVVLDVSIGSVENLTVKLYTATDETGDGIINGLKEVQSVTGQSSFGVTATEPIAAIGFMNNVDGNLDITIDKVTFTIDGDADGGSEFVKEVDQIVPIAAIDPVCDEGVTVKDAEETSGDVVVNFVAEQKTAYFKIPSFVDMSKIKYFLLDNMESGFTLLSSEVGTPLNGMQLLGFTADGYATGTPAIVSDTSALITNGRTDITHFGLRSTAPTAGARFNAIKFIQKNLTLNGDYKTWKADAFNGLAHANSTAAIAFDGVDKMTFTFNNADDEAILRLPEGLNLANVNEFTFAFSANDTELNCNLYDADMNLVCGSGNRPYKKGTYWTINRSMMGDAANTPVLYIGISAASDEPAGAICIFDGVSVNEYVVQRYDENFSVPEYTTLTYTWEDIMKMEGDGWSGATYERVEDGILINYGKNYGEVALKLPAMIDLARCETITVKLSAQTVPVAVKVKKNGDTYITNYDKIYGSRTFQPYTDAQVNKIALMTMGDAEGSFAKFESITFVMQGKYEPTVLGGDGIVINGDFLDPDVSDWKEACWDTATITAETSATPIYDNVTTYGNYANRTSPYQGFAQDLTGRVEQNETYKFSFWAKLSDDYKGAPDVQRVISFSPYTVDKDGVADYNPNLQGTYAQVCEVGEWTYYEGTWKVTNANEIESVYIRIIEQGTNYGQGDCVLGDYAVTGVNIEVYVPEPPSIDEDVPNLKDELTADFGDDFIVGTAIAGNEFDDIGVEMLANKHFNAITLGNELKPDALMGYSETHTPLTTATINGQTIDVPTLRFGNADARLDQILEWNADHPENPIRVRGHVLVWHSQTMEWFFREGYEIKQDADGNENYVTPEVMNLRLEWYIKTVLEHYVGDDSKYKELFYGWDVVNEAVGDGTGRYRTNTVVKTELPSDTRHGSNSSWWAVYQSNEFIINAFKYANKYAPADVELYYNDYNECDTKKVQGICKLLSDVLAEEGTRIDAMGMQAHYNIFNPGMGTFEKAIRSYCAIVGKVQLTELDLKASGDIGTESGLQSEYEKQAEHYNKIYNVLRKLDAEEGIEIGGVTFWGTIDTYSWLQSKSNVGGASDGTMKQCPLLFDGNYKVKPAFWAWVDYSKVDPEYVQEEYDGSTKPVTPAEDGKTEDSKAEDKSEASSDSGESIEETTTVTVTVTPDDKKEGGSNVAPIAAGVAAAVVVVGAGVGAVLLKKKKGLPKKDK